MFRFVVLRGRLRAAEVCGPYEKIRKIHTNPMKNPWNSLCAQFPWARLFLQTPDRS